MKKPPVNREKRWLKQKGCKNAARMWREDMKMWVVVPMDPEKPFSYIAPEWRPRKVVFKRMKPVIFKSSPEQKKRHQKEQ